MSNLPLSETINCLERSSAHPGLAERLRHRRIDAFAKIVLPTGKELNNPTDLSQATIAARIEAGVQEAARQGIGQPHFV